jgi:hypothetical protein
MTDEKNPLIFAGATDGVGHILAPTTENCPKCGATPDTFYVANYSLIWHDGDVMCRCGHRVRSYDAG